MKAKIHPQNKKVQFVCSSCNTKFDLISTLNDATFDADVCSNCHPFYTGDKSTQKLKGRAERLQSKFNQGRTATKAKKEPVKTAAVKKEKKETKTSLEDLAKLA